MRSTLFICLVASLSWVASAEPGSPSKNVCNSRPYSDYTCLAHYAPAVNYCKQKYPSKVVCQTIKTVKTVTSTKPAQCGPTPAKYYARDANADADAELESRDNGDAWKWNQLKKKSQNELQTFCRCIGYPRTRYTVETHCKKDPHDDIEQEHNLKWAIDYLEDHYDKPVIHLLLHHHH
ncbi:uncharacterized protein MYCGRDRAFT_88665 [Zymoseptoria tritici IPO323]|uniref:Secreted protein n=1 Tax=Zymoseptoria tritici (strain CBS 115943 / IPO323) TaxID=336722 RepID=F9WZK0_ZYMTI|nr:uncharacterized protein MYCGRDRAFT_88665 [Zymoseptoria tritici IPO323]EGP90847.1 hypothetical protein MYCGRDRAFT_88665 [Zymoseptoria tritici IPO323]